MQPPRSTMAAAVQAGRSASKTSTDIFKTTRKNAPKHTELARAGLKARSTEKQAAMAADAKVKQTELKAESYLKRAEIEVDLYKTKQAAKKTMRKAGMVAAAGQAAAGGILASKEPDPIKPNQIDFSGYKDYWDRQETEVNDPNWGKADTETEEAINPMAGMTVEQWTAAGKPEFGKPGSPVQTPDAAIAGEATKRAEASKTAGGTNSMGFSTKDFETFRTQVSNIESGGQYGIAGGSGGAYDGRYQLGAAAKTDASRVLGVADPGHTPEARAAFRSNPQMQDQFFEAYTQANHNYLMGVPEYAGASNRRRLEILGYAHNQGMGGAEKYLKTGQTGYDGFNTPGTKYINAINSAWD